MQKVIKNYNECATGLLVFSKIILENNTKFIIMKSVTKFGKYNLFYIEGIPTLHHSSGILVSGGVLYCRDRLLCWKLPNSVGIAHMARKKARIPE